MAIETFNPLHTPDAGMDVDIEPRFIEAKFGDGYVQESPDGINTVIRELSPKFTNVRGVVADAIIEFLEPKALTREPFKWTPNGEVVERVWKCTKFSYAFLKGRYCNIQATFVETLARV